MNHDERLCDRPRATCAGETDRGATHADFAPTHLYFRKAKCLWDINVRQRCANTASSLLDGRGAPTPLLSRSTPAVRGAFAKRRCCVALYARSGACTVRGGGGELIPEDSLRSNRAALSHIRPRTIVGAAGANTKRTRGTNALMLLTI